MDIKREIERLKDQLSNMDYYTIKFVEGCLSEEEFALIKEQKTALRERINELEKMV